MKAFVALGSNLGKPCENLELAAQALKKNLRRSSLNSRSSVSSIYQSSALLRPHSPSEWRKPFANAVVELEWNESPRDLLRLLKKIETDMGRVRSPEWAPRIIDLDVLSFDGKAYQDDSLTIPHPQMWMRDFVLKPLSELAPNFKLPESPQTSLARCRELSAALPLWMGILNLTPDSFSDGGNLSESSALSQKLESFDQENIQIIDIGAESTRPGANSIEPRTEWERLQPCLRLLSDRYKNKIFRPQVSVDTYHPETAAKALEMGADIINDVGGAKNPAMIEILKSYECKYVLMHSLGIPADPSVVLEKDSDAIANLKNFALDKINELERSGIASSRIIFDPGIGFGKTANQSLSILKRINELLDLPVPLLVGHSRKSVLKLWTPNEANQRDFESIGVSLQLAARGVDILRVHEAHFHKRTYLAFQETQK